jgi:hypothetical protein
MITFYIESPSQESPRLHASRVSDETIEKMGLVLVKEANKFKFYAFSDEAKDEILRKKRPVVCNNNKAYNVMLAHFLFV